MKPLDSSRLRDRSDRAEIVRIKDPRTGELVSCQGHWLVAEIEPGQEGVAAAHLAGRGYGIFIPGLYVNGRWAALLPGYVFVNIFGIEHHRTRILACPGITDLLYENGHPSCPYVVPDWFIGILRNRERRAIEENRSGVIRPPRSRRRSRRRSLRIRKENKSAHLLASA